MRGLVSGRWWRGLGAGALGTLALTAWEPLRNAFLGRTPVYAVGSIARCAARRWLGIRLTPQAAQRWGLLLRWGYGPGLGALYALLRPRLPAPARWGGVLLGAAVGGFEALSFPRLGVTPPLRKWSRTEHALLALQVLLFGAVTEALLSRGEGQRLLAHGPGAGTDPGAHRRPRSSGRASKGSPRTTSSPP